MSKNLIESIVENDLISASDIFKSRMEEILECKLYEEKRRISAEMNEAMVGMGMSRKEMKDREEAGFVPAHYPPEKGGLGLSDYDKSKKETKKRLAARAKEARSKKKVVEQAIDEMRAPGEVPGSEERKADAQRLRSLRKGLSAVGADKRTLNKDYLATRKAQMRGVSTEVPASQGTIDQKKSDMDMSKMKRPVEKKPAMDMASLSAAGKSVNSILGRKGSLQKTVGKAPHDERVARATEYKAKRKTERVMNILGKGLRAVKRGAEEIGRTGGSI